MICTTEGQSEIAKTLGVDTTRPLVPTWADHVFSCAYVYATGEMTLSVKELRDIRAVSAYFVTVRARLGVRSTWDGLGQGAFTTPGDSVVVRKDDKVLVVDVHGLPDQFGVPRQPRRDAALSVAATIMGCWTGA